MVKLLVIFIALNIVNVIVQTFKSLATVKCGKVMASIVNALAYGIYTVVLVYMNCDLTLWQKVLIVAGTNLVGVFVVKFIEEKLQKDKLWKIEGTVNVENVKVEKLLGKLAINNIPYNYIDIGKYYILNCYCSTQNQSAIVKELYKEYNVKYFASESKVL